MLGLAITNIVTIVGVVGLGLLVLALMRRSQQVVPDMAEQQAQTRDRAVAIDRGLPVMESDEKREPDPRDDTAFENVLNEELDDLSR
jgi:hypothetical protein